ncbi:MAG: hypothetical protein WCR69_06895 [Sulfuricurvum sp.]|jgi:hypothetical protein
MLQISQDFAPPFKLILPYFLVGGLFYILSSIFLFFITPADLAIAHPKILAFVHFFLLGFVMMIIFGAMAQLVPVVLEVGHFGVELFYAIWPLLLVGTLMMALGFILYPTLLPFGGMVVLIAFLIFIAEIFLTLRKVSSLTSVMSSILIANIFLLFGIIFGLVMALGYAGLIDLNILTFLKSHIFAVVGGYVFITLMGLSVVLLPMFGLSHGFSKKPLTTAMALMSASVVFIFLHMLSGVVIFEYASYALGVVSLTIYYNLVASIYKTRARKEIDIYAKSLIFAYHSMVLAILFALSYAFGASERFMLASGWLLFFGLFGFAITGHMYKIVPFLVWFERFSPLVGKQKVPMLADMLPSKSSHAQLHFGIAGVVLVTIGILTSEDQFLKAGASFLLISSIAFFRTIYYMVNFKI